MTGSTPLDIARAKREKGGQLGKNSPCPCGSNMKYKKYTYRPFNFSRSFSSSETELNPELATHLEFQLSMTRFLGFILKVLREGEVRNLRNQLVDRRVKASSFPLQEVLKSVPFYNMVQLYLNVRSDWKSVLESDFRPVYC